MMRRVHASLLFMSFALGELRPARATTPRLLKLSDALAAFDQHHGGVVERGIVRKPSWWLLVKLINDPYLDLLAHALQRCMVLHGTPVHAAS